MRMAMVEGTTRLPQPLSRRYVWSVTVGGTLFCFSLAMVTQWLLYHHSHFQSFHGFQWGTSLVMVPAVAAMLCLLMYQAQRRRQATINRFMVVAEANHHIRNALTVLVAANYLQGEERPRIDLDLPKTYAVIQEAIERIEHTLAEVLPQINDEN
jgi:F0F1-type ATP synthase assembly protein I